MSTTVPAAAAETRAQVPDRQGRKVGITDRARHERNLGWMLAGPAFGAAGTVVGPDTAPARLRWIDGTSSRFTVKLLSAPGPIMAISVSR